MKAQFNIYYISVVSKVFFHSFQRRHLTGFDSGRIIGLKKVGNYQSDELVSKQRL